MPDVYKRQALVQHNIDFFPGIHRNPPDTMRFGIKGLVGNETSTIILL